MMSAQNVTAAGPQETTRMPALYLGHGAPPLLDDPVWSGELRQWTSTLPRPKAILAVSAHWEAAPLSLSATAAATPLVYDFGGFPERYYRWKYETPDAASLASLVASVLPDNQRVHQHSSRGLDHGAWVPLSIMYPDADIPVLQLSLPTLDPGKLLELGRRLAPLRDHGILIAGSGFLTHGLPFLREFRIEAKPPGWSVDFDLWATDAVARGDVESLMDFHRAPGMPYAHPSAEHLAPLFVTLGAAEAADAPLTSVVDGYWMGLAKRSFQVT
jgi:4,5-DOPA dioxygenase extradiol